MVSAPFLKAYPSWQLNALQYPPGHGSSVVVVVVVVVVHTGLQVFRSSVP